MHGSRSKKKKLPGTVYFDPVYSGHLKQMVIYNTNDLHLTHTHARARARTYSHTNTGLYCCHVLRQYLRYTERDLRPTVKLLFTVNENPKYITIVLFEFGIL
jgi:hypothetical protein